MDPEALRAAMPVTDDVAYFNTGASGPSPRPVVDAIADFAAYHAYDSPGGEGMYDAGWGAEADAREAVARLLGADSDDIALTQSTTAGINLVATGLDWQPGDVVVSTDAEHPSGRLPWARLADVRGVEHRVVTREDGRYSLEAFAEAIEGARLICLSAVTWNRGTRLPVEAVTELAHEAGATVLVDAVQAPGQLPVDVEAWGADFVAGAGHKWLLGPWGAGFLYLSEAGRRALDPLRIGPKGVQDPAAEHPEYHESARMFDLTTGQAAVYAGLEAAIDLHLDLGVDAVQDRIEHLTDRLKAGIPDDRLLSPREYETGLVSFRVDDPEAFEAACEDAGIVLRTIPDPECVRASVHAFNDESDVDRLLAQL
ncbi:MAG: aminotransferase class V-fold PLP-dependent enzyme [Halobacteriales archaeon]|nr:aminotransferase class V-fold PLP-dependent enzyme [Halobacteriales archaeon]